jgi:hypothetical protein
MKNKATVNRTVVDAVPWQFVWLGQQHKMKAREMSGISGFRQKIEAQICCFIF